MCPSVSDKHNSLMADAANEFVAAARAFRAALVADAVEDNTFAREVRNAVARVYLAAALLGPPATIEGVDDPPDRQSGDQYAICARLQTRFGGDDVFVDVNDPSRLVDEDTSPLERSLSWELAEIDNDLAEAITWFEDGHPDALWDACWAFENHWGQHAVSCLRPLHQLATYGVV